MKTVCLLLFFLGNIVPLYGAKITYISNNKKKIQETITSTKNNIFYNYQEGKKSSQIFMRTNENLATLSFTNITKRGTNAFYFFGGNLATTQRGRRKIIELNNLEVILLPEIQLQNFIKNKKLTIMRYMTIRLENCRIYTAQANKVLHTITNINNVPHTIVQVHYTDVSPKRIRFVYYFDPDGIASKKEAYFNRAKKPQVSLTKK